MPSLSLILAHRLYRLSRKFTSSLAYTFDMAATSFLSSKNMVRGEKKGSVGATEGSRLCVFSHYDPDGLIADYVIEYLKALKKADCVTIFVTTCKNLTEDQITAILPFVHTCIIRTNRGRDFGSWFIGLSSIKDTGTYEQIVLANDSVYGPLFDLGDVFEKMKSKKCDLWGITDSWESRYHLQTYFVVAERNFHQSSVFSHFWKAYRFLNHKHTVITRYEIGLSQGAIRAGFKVGALCEYLQVWESAFLSNYKGTKYIFENSPLTGRPVNPTHFFWKTLIENFRCPFIKVELLRFNPSRIPDVFSWREVIVRETNYSAEMIQHHLARVASH